MGWVAAVGERGETITAPGGGSGSGVYGPLLGAEAVRLATTPQSVGHPGGTPTVVNPGDSIQSKINTAGNGGVLWFVKGNHLLSAAVAALPGQNWYLESIAGYTRTAADSAIIDSQNSPIEQTIYGGPTAVDFKIHGGVFRRSGASGVSVSALNVLLQGDNSLIEDAIIKDNYNNALHLGPGTSCIARRVYMTNNGRGGFSADCVGGVLTKCRISFNNTRLLEIGGGGSHAGAMKVVGSAGGFRFEDNWIHDNLGYGIWPDVPNVSGGHKATGNVCEHNSRAGIFFEGPTGGCVISRNYLLNNGYDTQLIGGVVPDFWNNCQLQITNSDQGLGSGVRGQVTRNIFDYNLTQSENHGGLLSHWQHAGHPGRQNKWDVFENQWWFRSSTSHVQGRLNMTDASTTGALMGDADLGFFDNEYHVASPSAEYWTEVEPGTRNEDRVNYTQWQARFTGDDLALVTI